MRSKNRCILSVVRQPDVQTLAEISKPFQIVAGNKKKALPVSELLSSTFRRKSVRYWRELMRVKPTIETEVAETLGLLGCCRSWFECCGKHQSLRYLSSSLHVIGLRRPQRHLSTIRRLVSRLSSKIVCSLSHESVIGLRTGIREKG
jgi:hypothetical protein